MLIVPDKPKKFYDPVKTMITYRGVPLSLSIRPLDIEKEDELLDRAEKHEAMIHPESKQLSRVSFFDKDLYFAELADHLIADFSGVGARSDQPWPVDREHKVKLLSIVPMPGERPLWEQVRDRARAIAAQQLVEMAKEREADEKN